jgi:predicted Na+-dependent transporter
VKYLKRLPNSVREKPGLEWKVFRKLPGVTLLGTLVPLVLSLANRIFPPDGTAAQIEKYTSSVDILAIATVVTVWTAVLTVAIACFVVMIMKGHAYVADAYELEDSERPGSR